MAKKPRPTPPTQPRAPQAPAELVSRQGPLGSKRNELTGEGRMTVKHLFEDIALAHPHYVGVACNLPPADRGSWNTVFDFPPSMAICRQELIENVEFSPTFQHSKPQDFDSARLEEETRGALEEMFERGKAIDRFIAPPRYE